MTDRHSTNLPTARTLIKLGLACLGVAATIAWINRNHVIQGAVYQDRYLRLARYFQGEIDNTLFTYPVWGYSLVLSWLPNAEVTSIVLQVLLAVLAIVAIYATAAPYLEHRTPLAVLCVLAVPWYTLASVKLADAWSGSMSVLAICALVRAIQSGQWRWAIASGVLFGLGFNFRSDFLPVLAGLPIALLVFSPATLRANWRRLIVVMALAGVLLVPWGLYRVYHGASFGVTSTNAGLMLKNSLGFSGNAWGIISSDILRAEEAVAEFGEGADTVSPEVNAFFMDQALTAIKSNPLEFGRKILHNFSSSLRFGFYTIEVEPFLDDDDGLRFEVLKEQLKVLAGAKANVLDIEKFRELGVWDDDFSIFSVPLRLWVIAATPILSAALSAVFLLTLLVAIGRTVFFEPTARHQPVFLFCLVMVLSWWALVCLLQYEQRQMNVLYPLGLPLVALLLDRVAVAWKRRRLPETAGAGIAA